MPDVNQKHRADIINKHTAELEGMKIDELRQALCDQKAPTFGMLSGDRHAMIEASLRTYTKNLDATSTEKKDRASAFLRRVANAVADEANSFSHLMTELPGVSQESSEPVSSDLGYDFANAVHALCINQKSGDLAVLPAHLFQTVSPAMSMLAMQGDLQTRLCNLFCNAADGDQGLGKLQMKVCA